MQDQADTSSLHPLVYCFCSADTPWLTALGEEIEGVSVTVNRGPIRKAEFLGNGLDTGPVDEFPLDLLPGRWGQILQLRLWRLCPCYRAAPTGSFQLRAKLALRSVLRAGAPRVGFSHRSPEAL